jgi:acyl-CoA hydrolase
MFEETTLMHLVRPEDLNHHGTLFAGQMAKWLVEAGVITAARLTGKPEDIVCVKLTDMNFKGTVHNGETVEIKTKIASLGKSSITVSSRVFISIDSEPLISSMAMFVSVDKDNKPYSHGFSLPQEYIEKNRGIYEEAQKIRKTE